MKNAGLQGRRFFSLEVGNQSLVSTFQSHAPTKGGWLGRRQNLEQTLPLAINHDRIGQQPVAGQRVTGVAQQRKITRLEHGRFGGASVKKIRLGGF
ncbi:hypothetical protein D3C76_1589130 [compost metagenome]